MPAAEKAAWYGFALLLAATVYVLFTFGNAGDKEISLVSARMLLQGKKLYRDIFTVQLPPIYYLYAVPVYISDRIGLLRDFQWLNLIGLAAIVWSAWAATALVARHPEFASGRMQRQHFLLALIVFITCSGAYYFFDREHMFLVLTFPYVMRFTPSLASKQYAPGFRLSLGVAAAIGFCVKPHCLIVFGAVQLLYFFQQRSAAILFSLENGAIYFLTGLYVTFVVYGNPDYVHIVLPMALATYDAANSRTAGMFFLAICLLIFAVTFVDFRLRYTSPYRRDIYYLLGVSAGFLGYALINNGWGYTYNPLACTLLVVTGWVGWEYLYLRREHAARELPVQSFVFGARACALNLAANALCVTLGALMTVLLGCRAHLQCDQTGREVLQSVSRARSFGTISLDFGIWARLVDETGIHWDTRFNQLWMLPKFFVSDAALAQKNRWILRYVADSFADDLNTRKPPVVFVDEANSFYSVRVHMDLLGLLYPFQNFREAWSHYRLDHSICPVKKPPLTSVKTVAEKACVYYVYDRIE